MTPRSRRVAHVCRLRGNTILPVGEGIALMKGSTTCRGNPIPTADSGIGSQNRTGRWRQLLVEVMAHSPALCIVREPCRNFSSRPTAAR